MGDVHTYWSLCFPWRVMEQFLTQGGRWNLSQREIGISPAGKDFMVRNKPYHTLNELRNAVIGNGGTYASRVEFGPIHPGPERQETRSEDMPLMVEFRCDVDVSDYAATNHIYGMSVHDCNHFSTQPACELCWTTRLEPSRKVLDYLLREILGAEHILWVFSGKKGYHAIVLDRDLSSRVYPDKTRDVLMKELVNPTDPEILDHVYDKILWPIFQAHYLTPETRVKGTPVRAFFDGVKKKDIQLRNNMVDFFAEVKYEEFRDDDYKMNLYYRRVMRALYWPRLDEEITIKSQHLLKLPFSPHDGTGCVSTPLINPDEFRPEDALKISDVCNNPQLLDPYVEHVASLMRRAFEDADDASVVSAGVKRVKK